MLHETHFITFLAVVTPFVILDANQLELPGFFFCNVFKLGDFITITGYRTFYLIWFLVLHTLRQMAGDKPTFIFTQYLMA